MSLNNLTTGIAVVAGLVSIVYLAGGSIGISFIATDTLPNAWADDKDANEYDDVEDLARDVDDGELDDDNIDYSEFKASLAYQNADQEIQECIDEAEELGENLADYEVLECTDEYEE
jgi:hypothetical protein